MSMMFHGCTGGPHHGWWTKRCRLRRLSLVTSFTLCSHGFLMAGNWGNGWRSQGWLKDEILVLWKYLVELRIYLHIYIYTWISTIGPDVMFKFLSLVQTYIYICSTEVKCLFDVQPCFQSVGFKGRVAGKCTTVDMWDFGDSTSH